MIFPGPIEGEAPRAAAAAAATGRAPPAAWLAVTRVRRGRRLVTEVPRYIEKRPIQPTERRPEDPCAGCANLLCLVVTVVWQTNATSARALLPWKPNTPAGRGAAVGDRRNWQSTRVGRKKSSFSAFYAGPRRTSRCRGRDLLCHWRRRTRPAVKVDSSRHDPDGVATHHPLPCLPLSDWLLRGALL